MAMRRELKPYGIGVTYVAPRATKTDPTKAFEDLVKPLNMRMDDPAVVAAHIWRAVSKDLDTAYAKGAERLFLLIQKFAPRLVDRAIAAQIADPQIRDYLRKHPHPAAKEGGGDHWGNEQRASENRFIGTMREPAPGSTPDWSEVTRGTVHRLQTLAARPKANGLGQPPRSNRPVRKTDVKT